MLDIGEDLIRDNSSPESFRRGEEYVRRGRVTALVRRGDELRAEVEGSHGALYEIRIGFDATGITEARCGCPYDWGGWCKHIVATLLCAIQEPEHVDERPALEEVLSGLDREQLRGVLLRLADQDPHLAVVIEADVSLQRTLSSRSTDAHGAGVDVGSIRSQVHSVIRGLQSMRPSEAYWHVGGVVDEVRRILEVAWTLIRAGAGRDALAILEAITDEYMEAWEWLDDSNGEVGEFFYELGEAWTEALLDAELSHSERESWSEKLEAWCEELEQYAGGESFYSALLATTQGWDHPALAQSPAKVDDLTESPRDEHLDEDSDGDLIVAALNVLERQGRHEEYLRLARNANEVSRYAVMLIRLDRTEDAVEYGLAHLRSPEEALAVAVALREQGENEGALSIGEHGLMLAGQKASLALWVRDLADEVGRPELALRAAVIGFREDVSLASWKRIQELAGERWMDYRDQLLDHLRRGDSYVLAGHVEIFLHEGLIGDAIAAVDKYPIDALLERVAEAAVESHPGWVISACGRQAGEIMDQGRSQHYSNAAAWLKKVRAAYRAGDRNDEWQAYLEGLIARHQRKYKLRPLLENLVSGSS